MLNFLLNSKPVLVGLHLAFAIIGIDAFLWYLGELAQHQFGQSQTGAGLTSGGGKHARLKLVSVIGIIGFALSWLIGGYYYVVYYGKLVKPIIVKGAAPWAHAVAMEAKEHIFLFIIPLAMTALILALLKEEEFVTHNLRRITMVLVGLIVVLGLAIGGMGYVISTAARWG